MYVYNFPYATYYQKVFKTSEKSKRRKSMNELDDLAHTHF